MAQAGQGRAILTANRRPAALVRRAFCLRGEGLERPRLTGTCRLPKDGAFDKWTSRTVNRPFSTSPRLSSLTRRPATMELMAEPEPKLPPPDPDPEEFPPDPVTIPDPEEPDDDVFDPGSEPLPA